MHENYRTCGRVENNTDWMDSCYQSYLSNGNVMWGGASKKLVTLKHWAAFRSKGILTMDKALPRAVPATGTTSWVGWSPRSDTNVAGSCSTKSLSVQYIGVLLRSSYEQCDKWDIGKFSESGRFDNSWFGQARRSEREVAYMIQVARNPSTVNTWSLKNEFWAS